MISIRVRSHNNSKVITRDITDTPASVFGELNIDVSTAHVNIDGTMLSYRDYEKTFEELSVTDGSSVNLTAIVKADGAGI